MESTQKPNLFLLPGLLNDARLWQHQVAAFSNRYATTVADLTGASSMAGLASNAVAQAPPGPFVLAGLSMGGYVALEIMRQVPGRVMALALLDTSARADTAEATAARRALMDLAGTDFPGVLDRLLPKLVHPSRLHDASIVEVITAMGVSLGKDAFLRQQEAIIGRVDSRPFLGKIQCPTLILCGREDVLTPVELHEEMAAGIPGASLVIIEQCGHLSPLGQPIHVTEAIRQWLLQLSL